MIRRLAEDDKDGVMAHKVLSLLWTLAHQQDVPTDIMDQALHAHTKILDYSCSQVNDKVSWCCFILCFVLIKLIRHPVMQKKMPMEKCVLIIRGLAIKAGKNPWNMVKNIMKNENFQKCL